MRKHGDPKLLKQVAVIRGLQRLTAETRASRAAQELREKKDEFRRSEEQRDRVEQGWLGSLTTPPLDLGLSRLWATACLQKQTSVADAEKAAVMAQSHLESCATELHLATMRRDRAGEMAQAALKAKLRHDEERALQDVSERFAQHRRHA